MAKKEEEEKKELLILQTSGIGRRWGLYQEDNNTIKVQCHVECRCQLAID